MGMGEGMSSTVMRKGQGIAEHGRCDEGWPLCPGLFSLLLFKVIVSRWVGRVKIFGRHQQNPVAVLQAQTDEHCSCHSAWNFHHEGSHILFRYCISLDSKSLLCNIPRWYFQGWELTTIWDIHFGKVFHVLSWSSSCIFHSFILILPLWSIIE